VFNSSKGFEGFERFEANVFRSFDIKIKSSQTQKVKPEKANRKAAILNEETIFNRRILKEKLFRERNKSKSKETRYIKYDTMSKVELLSS
jgi:dephospho-CoA kinase